MYSDNQKKLQIKKSYHTRLCNTHFKYDIWLNRVDQTAKKECLLVPVEQSKIFCIYLYQ